MDAWELVGSEKHVIGSVICGDGDFEAVIDIIWSGVWSQGTELGLSLFFDNLAY